MTEECAVCVVCAHVYYSLFLPLVLTHNQPELGLQNTLGQENLITSFSSTKNQICMRAGGYISLFISKEIFQIKLSVIKVN